MSSTVPDHARLEECSSRDVFNCARPCSPGGVQQQRCLQLCQTMLAWRIVAVVMYSTVSDHVGLEESSRRDVFNYTMFYCSLTFRGNSRYQTNTIPNALFCQQTHFQTIESLEYIGHLSANIQQFIEIWCPFWIMQIKCVPILGFLRTVSMVFLGHHRNSIW